MMSLCDELQCLDLHTNMSEYENDSLLPYGRALRDSIVKNDSKMETEALKSLGDFNLERAKLGKNAAEFDKTAALYAAALLRCTDPDMGQTLKHCTSYTEELSRQLQQGYSPRPQWLLEEYLGTVDNNVLRVAEICDRLDQNVGNEEFQFVEDTYIQALVIAIANGDTILEQEVLKSLGDFYLGEGKKTFDTSQLSKAAAMYNKALTICEVSDAKQTLLHRLRYTEKVEGSIKQLLYRRTDKGENQSDARSKSEDGTNTDYDSSQYKVHIEKGSSSLQQANLDSAEQHFAAALKLVHTRDSTVQQYQREVEPLYKLGDVYRMRGQQAGDGGDFVKATALYNAAIARSSDTDINGHLENAIKLTEEVFVKHVLGLDHNVQTVEKVKHKKYLMDMRDQIKLEMETIDQQLDPYVHDEDNQCVKEEEVKRVQSVRQLFERIAQERNGFISLLVDECIGLMGPPPCKFALMGLGSQATELVTPYSDLEFAILTEKETEECLVYFRTLTHYLHLKVVNLGETILPALGIRSLNDFYSEDPLDDWYYDSVTPRGFAFDGSMPRASKTPLGRQATTTKPASELIHSPGNMVYTLVTDATVYINEGYHLASILRNPCLMVGDKGLLDEYRAMVHDVLTNDEGKMALMEAQDTWRENMGKYEKQELTAKLIDVKKEIYRMPSLAVDCCALCTSVIPTSVWNTIDAMESADVISAENAHHLRVLVSISAELRLKTYNANGGQNENMSALASIETSKQKVDTLSRLQKVFYVSESSQLFRYYYTAVPLRNVLTKAFNSQKVSQNVSQELLTVVLFDDSPMVKGIMYMQLKDHRRAIRHFEKAIQPISNTAQPITGMLLAYLGIAYGELGDYKKAASFEEEGLQMSRAIHGLTEAHPNIATALINFGTSLEHLGKCKEALDYCEKGLQMFKNIYYPSTEHHHIAWALENTANIYMSLGDLIKAAKYLEQALGMRRNIQGLHTSQSDVAMSLRNVGTCWDKMGNHMKAITYHEESLKIVRALYGLNSVHPDIALSLNNIGAAWISLGAYKKGIGYYEQALQIFKGAYGQNTAHPNIALSFNNLASAWGYLGDSNKALAYQKQVLNMTNDVYGENTANSDIANALSNLATSWHRLGNYKEAISLHEQALEMRKSVYGTAHPDIASSLRKLGGSWGHFGDCWKAIVYTNHALQMLRTMYGPGTTHPEVPSALNGLGELYIKLGNHRKAIEYCEEALQIERKHCSTMTENPNVAKSLNTIGNAWQELGDWKKALAYYEEALRMCRTLFGSDTTHPLTAVLLNNLGQAWQVYGDNRKAMSYCEEALEALRTIYGPSTPHSYIATALNNLGRASQHRGDTSKAIIYYEQAQQMFTAIYGQSTAHPDIAAAFHNLGQAWHDKGDQERAISYHEKALQMYRGIYGPNAKHCDIASQLLNLGSAWYVQNDYEKAISCNEAALQMYRSVYSDQGTSHANVGIACNHLGSLWRNLKDYKKAIRYHEEALQTYRNIHGQSTANVDIADSLQQLGLAWEGQGEYQKCIGCQEEALRTLSTVYGQGTAHPDIAKATHNLGSGWHKKGDYAKAVSYYEQALQIFRNLNVQNIAHSHIAKLSHQGPVCSGKSDHKKGISYNQESQMPRNIHGRSTAHNDNEEMINTHDQITKLPEIAKVLKHMGLAWYELRDYEKSLTCYKESLEIYRTIYDVPHPDIAESLNALGTVCQNMQDFEKTIKYNEEELQMWKDIFGQNAVHDKISSSLHNLGVAWYYLEDYQKAISYLEKEINMRKTMGGQDTADSDIADALSMLGTASLLNHDIPKAFRISTQALDMMRQVYQDESHPKVKTVKHNYDTIVKWLQNIQKLKK
ncbi:uncharacterized protein LOC144916140 [Branchiostoma floridae x Branchiostoma belcheri]